MISEDTWSGTRIVVTKTDTPVGGIGLPILPEGSEHIVSKMVTRGGGMCVELKGVDHSNRAAYYRGSFVYAKLPECLTSALDAQARKYSIKG